MWHFKTEQITNQQEQTIRYKIYSGENCVSFKEFTELMGNSKVFRMFFNGILSSCQFKAFFFEVAPVSIETLNNDFEFALID